MTENPLEDADVQQVSDRLHHWCESEAEKYKEGGSEQRQKVYLSMAKMVGQVSSDFASDEVEEFLEGLRERALNEADSYDWERDDDELMKAAAYFSLRTRAEKEKELYNDELTELEMHTMKSSVDEDEEFEGVLNKNNE